MGWALRGAFLVSAGLLVGYSIHLAKPARSLRLIKSEVVSLGEVPQGKSLDFSLTVENRFNSPVEKISINPSCGCTVIADVQQLAVGETRKIAGVFDTTRRRGLFETLVLMEYVVDGTKRAEVVAVRANVRPTVTYEPKSLDFQDGGGAEVVTFKAVGHPSWNITRISSNHPALSVSELPAQTEGVRELLVQVDYAKLRSLGLDAHARLLLDVRTDIEIESLLRIPVSVELGD